MDFSDSAFRTSVPSTKVSNDTISHTDLVMSCRWGWTSTPEANATSAPSPLRPSVTQPIPDSNFANLRTKRFAPCQGRLYHQLLCSHRIRTDLVEDCGSNCVEPSSNVVATAFMCNECIQAEASKILQARHEEHNTQYPPVEHMTKEQWDQYYLERRQLEADFVRDHKAYELDLRANMRPSNICSALEASKEETAFADELDSLTLSLMASNASDTDSSQPQPQRRARISLPNDASEQLHWNLNTLALDRGACGVEYSASSPNSAVPSAHCLEVEDLWRKPRER